MTGGDNDDGYNILDSTEVLDLMKGRWLPSGAKLPHLMTQLGAVNIDGRVLIFGKMTILNPYSKSEPKHCGPKCRFRDEIKDYRLGLLS